MLHNQSQTMPDPYTIIPNHIHRLKPDYRGLGLPARVSIYGAAPRPAEAYEMVTDGYVIRDNKSNTVSNYFYGKRIHTLDEAQATLAKLNA